MPVRAGALLAAADALVPDLPNDDDEPCPRQSTWSVDGSASEM